MLAGSKEVKLKDREVADVGAGERKMMKMKR